MCFFEKEFNLAEFVEDPLFCIDLYLSFRMGSHEFYYDQIGWKFKLWILIICQLPTVLGFLYSFLVWLNSFFGKHFVLDSGGVFV